jgi:ATP-dependent RNA helicase DDX19/DBP5
MIFCQTRKTASWLADKMTKDGHAVALLSGELSVEDRIKVLIVYKPSGLNQNWLVNKKLFLGCTLKLKW